LASLRITWKARPGTRRRRIDGGRLGIGSGKKRGKSVRLKRLNEKNVCDDLKGIRSRERRGGKPKSDGK